MSAPAPHLATGGTLPGTGPAGGPALLDRALAVAATALVTLDVTLVEGVTTGVLAAVVLVPVWWSSLREYVGARVLLLVAAVASVSGLWLAAHSASSHVVSPLLVRSTFLMVAGGFCAVGLLLWARTVLPLRHLGTAAGLGLVLGLAVDPPNPVNPWKFGISYAVAVLALGLVARHRPRWAEVLVLLAIAATSALNDSRSSFAILLLAAVLLLWQLRPTAVSRRASGLATMALLGAVAVCVYLAGTALILEGYLGEATRQRSLEQIQTSGSVLLGGRPEWGATLALFAHQPWGYGTGVQANLVDILVAKSGMAGLNYDPDNGYVENYMFGGAIKLHAVVPDLWAAFGIPGLVLAAVVTGLVVWSLATAVARRTASGLVVFLTCTTLWNLAFGPLYSSMPPLVLTLGLLLLRREPEPATPSSVAGRGGGRPLEVRP